MKKIYYHTRAGILVVLLVVFLATLTSSGATFTAFENIGYSGVDVDWSGNGNLVAILDSGEYTHLVENVLTAPALWNSVYTNCNSGRGVVFSPDSSKIFVTGNAGAHELAVVTLNYLVGGSPSVTAYTTGDGATEYRACDWGNGILTGRTSDQCVLYYTTLVIDEQFDMPRDVMAVAFDKTNPSRFVFGSDYDAPDDNIKAGNTSGTTLWTHWTLDEAHVRSAAWFGSNVIVGDEYGKIYRYSTSGSREDHWTHGPGNVTCAEFSPDGQWLATCGGGGIKIWKTSTWAEEHTGPSATCVAWDPTSSYLVDNAGNLYAPFNHHPVLEEGDVDPDSGSSSQLFTYVVRYTDEDGDMPSVHKVYINGTGYDMEQYIGSDPTVGIWYRYQTYGSNLGGGSHDYYFYFEDGGGGSARLPSGSDTYPGPDVYCWVLIYYWAHGNDSDMDGFGIPEKYDAIQTASSSNTNFQAFMLWDRLSDASPDRLYRIYDGASTNWTGPEVGLPSEFDMADPATLVTCVDWVMDNYDADHYALVTFNHGAGIYPKGIIVTAAHSKPLGMCWDGSDYLSVYELGLALQSIETMQGPKLEVLHLDACLMQMIEINYQIYDYVDYVVGSENEGWFSWGVGDETYEDEYLASVTSSTLAQSLAVSVAQAYDTFCDGKNLAHTISVLCESQTENVVNNLHSLATTLIDNMWDVRSELGPVRHYTQKFDYNTETPGSDGFITQSDDYLDLKDMAIETYNRCSNSDVQAAASALNSAIGDEGGSFVEFEEHLSVGNYNFDGGTYGVSIYWPDSTDSTYQDYIDISPSGSQLTLCAFTNWDDFLQAYLEWKALKVTSSGASSVSITCTTDELSRSDGITPFTRVYEVGTSVSLAAPQNAGGKEFVRWERDGSPYSTSFTVVFNMDDDYNFEAVYGSELPTAVITSISPSPASPQIDTVEFREDSYDNDEAGFTIVAWEWSSNRGDWEGNSVLSDLQNPDIHANDLAVGTHTITLWVEDDEGDTDTATDTLIVSNVTPVIDSLDVTRSGSETVNISGTAHDRDEHQRAIIDWEITVTGDDYDNVFTVGSNSLNYSLDTNCLAAGNYTISARAEDDELEWSDSVIGGAFDVNSLSPDIDGDGCIDFADYARLASHYKDAGCSCPEWCESTDLDRSGSVNLPDLALLCERWLEESVCGTWWNSSWNYRKQVVMTNNVETTLYDYSMKIILNTAELISQGKMQSDCGDIRIIENGVQIDYGIIGPNSASTEICFIANDLIVGDNNDIHIYYGNPSAGNGFVANWKDAFYIWHDDFDTDRGWDNCPNNTRAGSVTVDTVNSWLYADGANIMIIMFAPTMEVVFLWTEE
ncbi:MAG: clostripain-related cysteine peptidase [Planctomycetota bacterium]|jgi:hypothetical protein